MRYFLRMNKTKITDKFIATDKYGETYQITEFTEYTDATIFAGSEVWEDIAKEYWLDGDLRINRINDTDFEIVRSGVRLTRQSE